MVEAKSATSGGVKRKREPEAGPSTSKSAGSKQIQVPTWQETYSAIQGSKGEPGAVIALGQLSRTIAAQASHGIPSGKKSEDAHSALYAGFLSHWASDPGLKDVVAAWERGDQSSNSSLTIAALSVFSTLLSVSASPSAGIISLHSEYAGALSKCIQELLGLLHYLTKYLANPGKNDLTTAALELVAALLKIVRLTPHRASTSRKVWTALALDGKILARLLSTKRKIPLITKAGRKPDIRHLALSFLLTLLVPGASVGLKTDILSTKGLIAAIWKGLSEDPREVVESTLECMAYLVANEKLPLELRVRVAEDSWAEVLKLYARSEAEPSSSSSEEEAALPPASSAHRYLLYVTTALGRPAPLAGPQKRALGTLLGLLQISDSEPQSDVAAHILQQTPEMLSSFWARFAPSLEPRLSSRWATSVGFAGRVIGGPVPNALEEAYKQAVAYAAEVQAGRATSTGKRARKPPLLSTAGLLDTALLPASLGRTWLSKALQTHGSTPLVSFLACNFLYIGMRKALALSEASRRIGLALPVEDGKAWLAAAKRIKEDARERIPELQVLIALVQNGLGRAFSRAGSVASTVGPDGSVDDGEPAQEDNTLLLSLALRTIKMYHSLVPAAFSNLRFEFGRLLSSPFFASPPSAEAAPLAALGQAALLDLLSSSGDADTGEGAIVWQWSKSIEGGRSALASIIGIYLSTKVEALRVSAGKTVRNLLGTSLLFEHDPEEAGAWLAALSCANYAEQDEALSFLDNCVQRCLQAPFRYVDGLNSLLNAHCRTDCANESCRSASPLLATVLEQLKYRFTRPESAQPYSGFVRRLSVELAARRDCLCVSQALVQQALADNKDPKGQPAAVQDMQRAKGILQILSDKSIKIKPRADSTDGQLESFVCALADSSATQPAVEGDTVFYIRLVMHRLRGAHKPTTHLLQWLDKLLDHTPLEEGGRAKVLIFGGDALLSIVQGMVSQGKAIQGDVQVLSAMLGKHVTSPQTMHLLRPLASVLIGGLPAQQLSSIELLLPVLPPDLLLAALARNPPTQELSTTICKALQTSAARPEVRSAVLSHYAALLAQGGDGTAVLAEAAEASLPPTILATTDAALFSAADLDLVRCAAESIMGTADADSLSLQAARVLAVAVYRFPAIYAAWSSSLMAAAPFSKAAPALRAWLEVTFVRGETVALRNGTVAECIEAFLKRDGGHTSLHQIAGQVLSLAHRASPGSLPVILKGLGDTLSTSATTPAIFDKLSLETLADISRQTANIEAFALLETLVNESMKWLVRRFAEDEANTEQVSDYILALAGTLADHTGRWLLKPHLVEPVLQAIIQNRTLSSESIAFAAALLKETKLQDAAKTRLLQSLLTDSKFRLGLATDHAARGPLVDLVEVFQRQAPDLLGQLGATPALLAAYGGSLSKSDRALLRIFKMVELTGQVSIRSSVRNWVPPHLRGVASGSFQVLSALNPETVYAAQVHLLSRGDALVGRTEDELRKAMDPTFFLAMLGSLLDAEDLGRIAWMSMAESNVLGLAICALASGQKALQIAGDRLLAKTRNALQASTAEFREKEELSYILDNVKNLILPSATSNSTPIPPSIALFLAQAIRSVALPETQEYPLIWRFLLSRPVADTKDVPLFYNLFYSSGDDSDREKRWLLRMMTDGACTSDDWRVLRRRQAVELFVSYLLSGVADDKPEIRLDILKFFAKATRLPAAVQDLVGRSGFFGSLALLKVRSAEEAEALIAVCDNCISNVQPTKLRRARDGLWAADAVQALLMAWRDDISQDSLAALCHALRRLLAYLSIATSATIDLVVPLVLSLATKVAEALRLGSQEAQLAVRQLYEAVLRMNFALKARSSGELLDGTMLLALRAGVPGVREDVIRCWHASSR